MKEKLIMIFSVIILLFGACKTEPDSEAIKKEVLNIHDKLMIDGEKVIRNRMKLDTILIAERQKLSPDTIKIKALVDKLNKADENMMDWMHSFNDEFKGKNEQEDIAYYKSQMISIRAVEDSFIKATKESDSVLKIYLINPAEKMEMSNHKH
ncbi:hypothetical protein QWY86_16375 [Pedobacter aquatilis]|uniref:hypothetical protein n=1 Tax=Pedobacter aquatilis TaxID=351343 RepID=UPI0025B57035|nr:hypothetical protein [Pedobacter aquatilis]MDN3588260.1 hypothetical protein [Pedobacter aquatilis]